MTDRELHPREKIGAWLDGELPPAEADAIARLVETDPQARREAERLRVLQRVGETAPSAPSVSPAEWDARFAAVMQQVAPRLAQPTVLTMPAARSRPRTFRYMLAAAAMFLVGLGIFMNQDIGVEPARHPVTRVEGRGAEVVSVDYDETRVDFVMQEQVDDNTVVLEIYLASTR